MARTTPSAAPTRSSVASSSHDATRPTICSTCPGSRGGSSSRAPVNMCRIAREVVVDYANAAATRGIRFDVAVPADPCWVSGDGVQLAQVLGNVVGNALEFLEARRHGPHRDPAQSGAPLAHPSASTTEVAGAVAAGILPSIFDPFTQADRYHGGLGLGLSVVRGLVELHGGQVTAQSRGVGIRTELRISLPPGPDLTTAIATPASATTMRPFRILVVEDNADAAELLSSYSGPRATTLRRRLGDRRRANRRPVPTGCGAVRPRPARKKRLRGGGRAAPHTGDRTRALDRALGVRNTEDKRRSEQAGFDLHLTKPVSAIALLALLGELSKSGHAAL